MRIKDPAFGFSASVNLYQKNPMRTGEVKSAQTPSAVSSSHAACRVEKTAAAGRTDKIEITGHSKENSLPENLKENLVGELSEDTAPEKLENLKNQVSSGTYSTEPTELARILLTGK